jgi:uncharacterized protein YdeI (YjbR/CyaY-like superfamily)
MTQPTDPIAFDDAAAWEAWLAANHAQDAGVWLRIARKGAAVRTVTIGDALDVALCYGWIDGQRKAFDDQTYLQKMTPRRRRSLWSQVNVAKVAQLTAEGRMQPPGLAQVDAAKADGRWDAAYAAQRDATPPPDLIEALDRTPAARAAFDALDRTGRYAVIHQLITARTPATRAARLERAIVKLERAGT